MELLEHGMYFEHLPHHNRRSHVQQPIAHHYGNHFFMTLCGKTISLGALAYGFDGISVLFT